MPTSEDNQNDVYAPLCGVTFRPTLGKSLRFTLVQDGRQATS